LWGNIFFAQVEKYGVEAPFEYIRRIREVGIKKFWEEFQELGLSHVHGLENGGEEDESASSA
jgi:hypothetical protein